jgi:hypothetical protein
MLGDTSAAPHDDGSRDRFDPDVLGEHTDALLSALCGVDPEDLKRLREDRVV